MDRRFRLATLTMAVSIVVANAASAQGPTRPGGTARTARCAVEGAWELESQSIDGQVQQLGGYRQRKLVAHGHYTWFGHDAKRDTFALRTAVDTLRATASAGGAGPYTVAGDKYTERLELFVDPQFVGQSLVATCRTTGDRWYHDFETTADGRTYRYNEVWRRLR